MRYINLFLCCLLISGCAQKRIIDDVNLVQAVGYDKGPGDTINGITFVPNYQKKGMGEGKVYVSNAHTSKGIRYKNNQASAKSLVSGQLLLSLYDKELAKEGIFDILDTLNRDPTIGNLTILAVVDGPTQDLLRGKYETDHNTALYVNDLLEQLMKNDILPRSNLHFFLFDFFQKGMDPSLPLIKKEGDAVKLKGLALFRDDKYVNYLPYKDLFMFKALLHGYERGAYEFEIEKGQFVMLENMKAKTKYVLKTKQAVPEIDAYVTIEARIQEFSKRKLLTDVKYINHLERIMEKQLEQKGNKMVRLLQKWHTDPLGLGHEYYKKTGHFSKKEWEQLYPQIPVRVHVHLEIVQQGVVE